jgi:Cu/Ag efflux protein CusF
MGMKLLALLSAAIICIAVVTGTACSTAAQTKPEKPRQYQMRGVVVRVSPRENLASINAEKIQGWMDAMTMEYPVENKKEYTALRVGEKITATVNVTSEGFWLTNVKERKD